MLVAEEAVEIRVLSRQGKSIRDIARMLKISRNTVRRYLRGDGLTRYERKARPSKVDDYKQYIAERVRAGLPPEKRHENELESATGRRRTNEGEPVQRRTDHRDIAGA
jgi:transposase